MTNRLELYRCEICGNIVQVMHPGMGELVCCGKPMSLLKPYTKENEKQEKHVPVFMENKIQVGSVLHPMTEEHHIEFIQTITDNKKSVLTKFLEVNESPEMTLNIADIYTCALEYCNLHGLWAGNK